MNEDLVLNVVSDVVRRLNSSDAAKSDFTVIHCISDLLCLRDSLVLSVKYKIIPKVEKF